jgi:hypothetical protein
MPRRAPAILFGKFFDRHPIDLQSLRNSDEQVVVDDSLPFKSNNPIRTFGDVPVADQSSEFAEIEVSRKTLEFEMG